MYAGCSICVPYWVYNCFTETQNTVISTNFEDQVERAAKQDLNVDNELTLPKFVDTCALRQHNTTMAAVLKRNWKMPTLQLP